LTACLCPIARFLGDRPAISQKTCPELLQQVGFAQGLGELTQIVMDRPQAAGKRASIQTAILCTRGIDVASVDRKKARGLRLFHCSHCGHHLRLGGSVCGSCYRPTPFYNRRASWIVAALLIAGAAIMALR
jgi:hypothetical protein